MANERRLTREIERDRERKSNFLMERVETFERPEREREKEREKRERRERDRERERERQRDRAVRRLRERSTRARFDCADDGQVLVVYSYKELVCVHARSSCVFSTARVPPRDTDKRVWHDVQKPVCVCV